MDFSQAEAEFENLKARFEAGDLTDAEFKARLEELMIQDAAGRWWMIGYETGQWYRHDGETWVQSEPPAAAGPPAAGEARKPEADRAPQAPPAVGGRWQRLRASLRGGDRSFALWMGVGWVTGLALGYYFIVGDFYTELVRPGVVEDPSMVSAIPNALSGAIVGAITGLLLRRTEPSFRWKQIVLVAIGWAMGWAVGGAIDRGTHPLSDAFDESAYVFGAFASPVYGLITVLIGGLATGLALRWTELRLTWKQVLTVAIGCLIGYVLLAIILLIPAPVAWPVVTTSGLFRSTILRILRSITVGVVGAIVGWVVSWQVSVVHRSSP